MVADRRPCRSAWSPIGRQRRRRPSMGGRTVSSLLYTVRTDTTRGVCLKRRRIRGFQTAQNVQQALSQALHEARDARASKKCASSGRSYAWWYQVVAAIVTCYRPLKAYRSAQIGPSGKRGITFNPHKSYVEGSSFSVPCGQCIGCRIERSRQWAARCVHEAQMHQDNSFVTLTYSDDHLPADYSVDVRELQLFMKRLRKSLGQQKIRYFACGEYGDENLRPHYHALIFNYLPNDLKKYSQKNGHTLYTSKSLSEQWTYGNSWIGSVTYQSAAYVARYVMKKIGGDRAADYYTRIHPKTGLPVTVKPEFATQSRRPGIGSTWFEKYQSDCFPSDFLIVDGKKISVPKFYSARLEDLELERVKRLRKRKALRHKSDQTKERLAVRELVVSSRISRLKRSLK